jgi:hypothetical protein
MSSVERRLQRKLPADEPIAAWGRAWVSRDGRMSAVFAARTLDFAVLTDDHLYLYSTGFFTRRPRRRVYAMGLDRLHVDECKAKAGLRFRVWAPEHRPLLLEMRATARNRAFMDELFAEEYADPDHPDEPDDAQDLA